MTPIQVFYYLGYSFKKWSSRRNQKRLPHKVISIGNITVGGTGKTPAAIAVAEEAKKRGYRPVILTRGYRGKAKGPCFVNAMSSVEEAGDEPVLMAVRLKDVPVVKSADRYEGGIFSVRHLGNDGPPLLFILDDGFQHWQLKRDVDVVLVDGLEPFGNRKMLPVGPLRGPVSELKEADIIVITRVRNDALANEIKLINNDSPVYFASHEVLGMRGPDGIVDLSLLHDKNIFAFCGIANPSSFRKTLSVLGCKIVGFKSYPDHYRYIQADMTDLQERSMRLGADFLVTTEKDIVKIRELLRVPLNLLVLEIGFIVDKGFYDEVFKER